MPSLVGTGIPLLPCFSRIDRGGAHPCPTAATHRTRRPQIPGGALVLTDRGRDFIKHRLGEAESFLDLQEGLVELLTIVADSGPAHVRGFEEAWTECLKRHSRFRAPSSVRDTLRRRLNNLLDRALIDREHAKYTVSSRRPDAFRRNLLDDCDRMEASLMPIARHSMWEEVGRMVRIPFSSTVLQRRRGYRRVLQHFSRIRLAPMIPLDKDGMRDLLELKNIALLYELWTFFRLVHEISAVLGSPPVRSGRLASDLFQTAFAAGGTFEWDPGVRLVYNQRFSRSRRGQRHSYSVPLIPDIALRIPDGPNAGLHLFDAKFRVQALTDVGLAADDKDADDEKPAERAGSFKRADIYKMHAYRDAIPDARSVWILYPGGQFRFFGVPGGGGPSGRRVGSSPEGLPGEFDGVGAIPVGPVVGGEEGHGPGMAGASDGVLRATLGRMLPG